MISSQLDTEFTPKNYDDIKKVITTASNEYTTSFGFTEEVVFRTLEECGLEEEKAGVKQWYDGFVFGKHT